MSGRRKLTPQSSIGALEPALADGRRRISLGKNDREFLERQQKAEAAAVLFLDLSEDRKWTDIAQELGISMHALKDLVKTPEFAEKYNALFAELGHDPRYRAAQGAISDLLPLAVQKLRDLLLSPTTPPGTMLKAVEKVLLLNGLTEPQEQHSDRQELVKFLVEHKIEFSDIGIPLPPEYAEVIDAEFHGGELPETIE